MTATAPLRDRVLGGRYQVGARRGAGVDVVLFDAVDLDEQRPVAVKVVHPDLVADPQLHDRLVAAVSAVADLRHPNLAAVYDWGFDNWHDRRVMFLVVEVLRGGSLREILDRGRLLSPSQTLAAGLDACRGLDVLHRRGMVHGDVRPASLVFGEDGRLRLVDVGVSSVLAARTWSDPASLPIDRARYASPEQAKGEPLDSRTDVYSLCLSLLEAATGQVPFVGDSTVATLANRVDRLMPVSADLGPLASVLERGGRPDVVDRSTAAELGRALMQAAENLPRPAPMPLVVGTLFDAAASPVAPGDLAVAEPVTATPGEPAVGPVEGVDHGAAAAAADPAQVDTEVEADVEVAADAVAADAVASEPVEGGSALVADATGESTPASQPEPAPARTPATRGPRVGRRGLVAISAVVAVVLVVVAVWALARTPSHEVPALAGLDRGQALNAVAELDWSVAVVEEPSENVAPGRIVRTDPATGESLAEGGTLTLVISTGPAPRALPELAGRTVDEAADQLQAMGLMVQVGEQPYDEVVPAGTVISWSVPAQPGLVAGDTVVVGTQIVLAVSNGPAPRSVAPVTGLGLAEATAALTQQQLVTTQLPDEFSDVVPAGQVLRQDPAPGTEVARGSTVIVVLSKGPDLVPVPDLGPLDPAGVQAALTTAGLRVGAVTGDPTQPLAAASIGGGAPLAAGQLVPRNSVVDLSYPVPAQPVVAEP